MTVEAPPRPVEQPFVPERAHAYRPLVGLQGRLLLGGDAINPANRHIPRVDLLRLQSSADQVYTPLANASMFERREQWRGQEGDFSEKKQRWAQQTVEAFQSAQPFFEHTEGRQWSNFLGRMDMAPQGFSEAHANRFYDKYLATPEGIKRFVDDILRVHTQQGRLDYDTLSQNTEAIQWLANVFGQKSSEIITQLADAKGNIQEPARREQFIQELNHPFQQQTTSRINTPQEGKEVQLLQFLWNHSIQTPQHEQTPPPSPSIRRRAPAGYRWTYERPKEDRFASDEQVALLESAKSIAQGLREKYPDQYANVSQTELAQRIEHEQRELQQELDAHGLTQTVS